MQSYVEFHSRSAFSFLRGASLPEELAAVCAELDHSAMALLDRDGVYGSPRFHLAAQKLGIRAHIGAEVTLQDGSVLPLLVQSRAGYQNLCRLITQVKLRSPKHSKGNEKAASYDELAVHAEGLIALTGGGDGPIAQALSYGRQNGYE